ncbi:GGDEF domain-containing protein [Pokkaliibacter sp. CJK22405]|uniref:GGDEF domain-containing protein n=1 Tax=Pokkaliibacter sp. CJK22405 TaxID=3384615 RepID=UPI00398507D4
MTTPSKPRFYQRWWLSVVELHPRLSLVSGWLLLVILLLLGGMSWYALGLLSDIERKSLETRTEHLPGIVKNQQVALRLEQLGTFISQVYWARDAYREREIRLDAQVLVTGLGMDVGPPLSGGTQEILNDIRQLISIREEQRNLTRELAPLVDSLTGLRVLITRFLPVEQQADALMMLGDYQASLHALFDGAVSLSQLQLRTELFSNRIAGMTFSSDQKTAFLRKLNSIGRTIKNQQTLERVSQQLRDEALDKQRSLSNLLSTDAAYRAQKVAEEVQRDADKLKNTSLILVTVMLCGLIFLYFMGRGLILRPLQMAITGLSSMHFTHEKAVKLPRVLFRELDAICRLVEQYADMTQALQRANGELRTLSQRDGLTGVANRRFFDHTLEATLARTAGKGPGLALAMIDLDHFKRLNDRYGHDVGDDCLRAVGALLKQRAGRAGGLAARFGGEEFALILPGMSVVQARELIEVIREDIAAINSLRDAEGNQISMTASIGWVHVHNGVGVGNEEVIRQADRGLYQAKAEGRNRVIHTSQGEVSSV